MKSRLTDHNLLTLRDMSDRTGLSRKSLICAVKRLGIPRKKVPGINAYAFTDYHFKKICADDYIFEKLHNYKLRDYSRPPVVITYYIYESKMNNT